MRLPTPIVRGPRKRRFEIEVVHPGPAVVGESPLWHPGERALYWVDTRLPAIQRRDARGQHALWPMPRQVGSIALRRAGGLVVGMAGGFHAFDSASAALTALIDPEPDRPNSRLNDGKCDRMGRYWCGSQDAAHDRPLGALYRLDPDMSCRQMDRGFHVSNGIAFSPDDRTMYLADSTFETVYAWDFDLAAGAIANRRVFLSTAAMPGRVDGATCDADGCYWAAMVHDWSVARFDSAGRLDMMVRLPVRHPTMCAFGGDALDVLYVTSATAHLAPGEAEAQPLAGAVFAIHGLGVQGVPEPAFGG